MDASKASPVEAVQGIFRERYEGARVVDLGGLVFRGKAPPTSVLDMVVVYERLPNAYREAFVYGGWPVEAFVHDAGTLEKFFEQDRRRGVPSLMSMVWEGVEVPEACELSEGL